METLYLKSSSMIEDLKSADNPYLQKYLDLFGKGMDFEKQEDEIDRLNSLNITGNLFFSYIDVSNRHVHMMPEIIISNKVVYVDPNNETGVRIDVTIIFTKCKIVFTQKTNYNKLYIVNGRRCRFDNCEIEIQGNTMLELEEHARCTFMECILSDNGNYFQLSDSMGIIRSIPNKEEGSIESRISCDIDSSWDNIS